MDSLLRATLSTMPQNGQSSVTFTGAKLKFDEAVVENHLKHQIKQYPHNT